MIKIVTDSMASLSKDILDEYHITLIPAYVTFGTETLRDQIDLTPGEFYKRLIAAGDNLPTTTQASVQDCEEYYRRVLAADPQATILSIHISGALSGTLESARQAAAHLPDADIRIFDTHSVALGEGLQVRQAALMAGAGSPLAEILSTLSDMREHMQMFFIMDTLEYLFKGGRIGRAARLMGSLLDMKPMLTFENGAIAPYERYRSRPRALTALHEKVMSECRNRHGLHMGVMHAVCEDEARALADKFRTALKPDVLIVGETGPAVGVHTGPGALGVSWWSPQEQTGSEGKK